MAVKAWDTWSECSHSQEVDSKRCLPLLSSLPCLHKPRSQAGPCHPHRMDLPPSVNVTEVMRSRPTQGTSWVTRDVTPGKGGSAGVSIQTKIPRWGDHSGGSKWVPWKHWGVVKYGEKLERMLAWNPGESKGSTWRNGHKLRDRGCFRSWVS